MATKVRSSSIEGAYRCLVVLQSRRLYRTAGRRFARGIEVLTASQADLAYVDSRLHRGVSSERVSSDPGWTSLVAILHGRVMGFIQVGRHHPEHARYGEFWVQNLDVLDPWSRGLGIGEAMVRGAIEVARVEGGKEIWVMVREGNHAACSLYRKLGFERAVQDDLEETLDEREKKSGLRFITMMKRLGDT